jgi:hypothetical protein
MEKVFAQLQRAMQDECEAHMAELAPATPASHFKTLWQSKSDEKGDRAKKVPRKEDILQAIGRDLCTAMKDNDESAILHVGAVIVGFGLNHTQTEVRGAIISQCMVFITCAGVNK